jgi:hypothetical protein
MHKKVKFFYGFFKKFHVAIVALEITMNSERIASIVNMNSFGSIKVTVWELFRYIDSTIKAMNSEFAKFAANKNIHLNFILKNPSKQKTNFARNWQ